MSELEGFRCHTCGNWHEGLPLDYSYDSPHYWSENLRSRSGCFLTSDFCVIENRDFFIRGLIEIRVVGTAEPFRWGVWVSLKKENFDRVVELWDDSRLLEEPPYFGWLSNSIDVYPETLSLKANVHCRTVDDRPFITLHPTDHPLAVEQRQGMTLERVREIAESSLHK